MAVLASIQYTDPLLLLIGYSTLKEQYVIISKFTLGSDIYRLFSKEIEALRNTTFHLHKCTMVDRAIDYIYIIYDRPDPFIFQEGAA